MIVVILESGKHSINKEASNIAEIYPDMSRIMVNESNIAQSIKIAETIPLKTPTWCFMVDSKVPLQSLELLEEGNNLCLVKFRSQKRCEDYCMKLAKEDITFDFVDCTKFSKHQLIEYAMNELNINESTATYLCSRCRYSATLLTNSVEMLLTLDKVDKSSIKEYVETRADVSMHYLLMALLGYKGRYATKMEACCKLLYQFRFAKKYLYNEITKELTNIHKVYEDVYSGTLTLENAVIYKGVKSPFILDYVRLSKQVSYDYIIYVENIIETMYQRKGKFNENIINILYMSQDTL